MVTSFGKCVLFCIALLISQSGTNVVTKTQTVSIGDVASLECPFDISDLLIVQWSHTVKEIMIHNILSAITNKVGKYTSRYRNESNSAILEFTVNSTEDVGNYQCVVYSHTATKKTIVWLELDLQREGRVTNSGEVLASMGEDTHLAWKWQLLTSPSTVVWQHNHELLVHHVSKISEKTVGKYTSRVVGNGTMMVLEISAVDLNDAGIHSCFSYLRSGAGLRNTWVLQVEGTCL
ncbi:hypothetical protein HOLleu_05847 [Holothuria leucospilota]|uniref:Ig-like domain-containing protein n=1 Tax=Holothuria leucospilota TaxID=206669 RepID=A0A9Q1CKN0_HOLLE|nr:hypothetical protein HOLleu_05847 [Holothuria leucospilota]